MPNQTEYKLHIAIKEHIERCFIGAHNPNLKFWHIPNRPGDAVDGFFKKQMGALAGIPDFQFGWPISQIGVLEIKPPGMKLSSNQNKFISWADAIGWHTGIARSVLEAHNRLKWWGLKAAYNSVQEPDYRTKQEKFQASYNFFLP